MNEACRGIAGRGRRTPPFVSGCRGCAAGAGLCVSAGFPAGTAIALFSSTVAPFDSQKCFPPFSLALLPTEPVLKTEPRTTFSTPPPPAPFSAAVAKGTSSGWFRRRA